MIELTDQQAQALEGSGPAPPRVTNPRTRETFVLLRAEEYERLKADDYDDSPWTREELQALAWERVKNEDGGESCDMTSAPPVVHSDPDILGGAPVFVGTRVPLRALFDYLAGGHPLAEFLDDFPSVAREQAVAVLRLAAQWLVADARVA